MTVNVKNGPARALTNILGVDASGKGGTASSIFLGVQLGVSAAGLTTQSFDANSWMTFAAPNTKLYMLSTFDHAGNLTRTWDQSTGRMDLYDSSAAGHSAGPAMVLSYNNAAPANNDTAGHYAYRLKDTNGNYNTIAYVQAVAATVAAAGLNSIMYLGVMNNVATGAGNAQPNLAVTIDGQQNIFQLPAGMTFTSSGNTSIAAATGPVAVYNNTANSRIATVGILDNFNGGINVTGGGACNLQSGGATGVSITTVGVTIGAGSVTLKFGSTGMFSANGAVATSLTGIGPTGASTTVQEWLTVKNASGVTRYIPCF